MVPVGVRHIEPSQVGLSSGQTLTDVDKVAEFPTALEQKRLKVEGDSSEEEVWGPFKGTEPDQAPDAVQELAAALDHVSVDGVPHVTYEGDDEKESPGGAVGAAVIPFDPLDPLLPPPEPPATLME